MNTIIVFLNLLSLGSSATVDRVESDYRRIAVVCSADACVDVPTVAPRKGGLLEGQQLGCETVQRGDGTSAVICGGSVVRFIGVDGTSHANPYAMTADMDCGVY